MLRVILRKDKIKKVCLASMYFLSCKIKTNKNKGKSKINIFGFDNV